MQLNVDDRIGGFSSFFRTVDIGDIGDAVQILHRLEDLQYFLYLKPSKGMIDKRSTLRQ